MKGNNKMKTKDINMFLALAVVLMIVGYATYAITDALYETPVVVSAPVKPVVTNAVVKSSIVTVNDLNRLAVVQPVATNKPVVVKSVAVVKKVKVASKFDLPGVDGNRLLDYLETAENPDGDPEMVGDKHMKHHAYGLLQIRQPCLSDVIKVARKDMIRKWGRVLTIKDMKNREMARWVARVYLWNYGKEYTRQTGKLPTYKIYAKIHNGGPNGWKPWNMDTRHYWARVVKMNGLEGVV